MTEKINGTFFDNGPLGLKQGPNRSPRVEVPITLPTPEQRRRGFPYGEPANAEGLKITDREALIRLGYQAAEAARRQLEQGRR